MGNEEAVSSPPLIGFNPTLTGMTIRIEAKITHHGRRWPVHVTSALALLKRCLVEVGSFLERLTGSSWVRYAQNRLVGRREGQKRSRNSFRHFTRKAWSFWGTVRKITKDQLVE